MAAGLFRSVNRPITISSFLASVWPWLRALRRQRRPIDRASHHQNPGDAGDLVGERHSDQFLGLARQQVEQPGCGASALGLAWRTTAIAPLTSRRRSVSSPARVITPRRWRPAVE